MADTKKDALEEVGLESSAFEALERDFQEVRPRLPFPAGGVAYWCHSS